MNAQTPSSPAQVQRLVGCEPSTGEKPMCEHAKILSTCPDCGESFNRPGEVSNLWASLNRIIDACGVRDDSVPRTHMEYADRIIATLKASNATSHQAGASPALVQALDGQHSEKP